jgi:hypothetical protein
MPCLFISLRENQGRFPVFWVLQAGLAEISDGLKIDPFDISSFPSSGHFTSGVMIQGRMMSEAVHRDLPHFF